MKSSDIKSLLKSRGIYPTSQRLEIANSLLLRHQHVTANQLHETLSQAGSHISKATVYNTLGLFVIKGLLREIFIDANCTFYDSNTSHHHHFYNMDTGGLGDINEPLPLQLIQENIPQGTSFENVDVVIRIRNSNT